MTKTRKSSKGMSRSSSSMSRSNSRSSMGKSMNSLQNFEQHIVIKFLEVLNIVKLYHWKTFSYATHKATDEFHQKIEENIDTFVETLLGRHGDRINLSKVKCISIKEFNSIKDFKREITDFSKYLTALNSTPLFKDPSSSDLLTIRDEILKDVNQFLYLLTFS
jgi:DNA-binding ferritin-like protein